MKIRIPVSFHALYAMRTWIKKHRIKFMEHNKIITTVISIILFSPMPILHNICILNGEYPSIQIVPRLDNGYKDSNLSQNEMSYY